VNPLARFSTVLPDLRWLVVKTDGSDEEDEGQMDLSDLRIALAKQPEQVRAPWDATVFVSTDPTSPLPVNWLATMILRQSLTPGQSVRGPMIVLGPPDDAGEVTPITQELIDDVRRSADQHRAVRT
jgi:hypothetical protein